MGPTRKVVALLLIAVAGISAAWAQEQSDSRTVLGSSNPNLTDGAHALLDGDIERGVELTLLGLELAMGRRERQAALSNLCAGYMMLEQLETALNYCNTAIAENDRNWRAYNNRAMTYLKMQRYDEAEADLDRGQEIAPNARSLKEARGILLDETEPVTPNIVIDDRRVSPDDEND